MLSFSKVVGRLPKLTRQSHLNNFCQPLKYIGIVRVNNSWFSNNASNKKTYKSPETTIKPEECVPESTYSKPKKPLPFCELHPNASCPPSCYEVCGKPVDSQKCDEKPPTPPPPYWKILATLIIAGVTIYAISSTNWFTSKKSDPQTDVSKRKRRHRRSLEKLKSPSTSSSIPKDVPYLLIGGGTAAFSAFRSIKSRDPKAKVLVITEETDFPYMRPPLSKELWYNTDRKTSAELLFKQWNGIQRSIFYEPQEFYSNVSSLVESDKGGVAVATGWKVTKIDVLNKTVILDDGYEIKYDKCLVATGASPKNLPIFESIEDNLKDKIITFRTKEDFLDLEDSVHDPKHKNIVVIGGGFLGSELACSLARNVSEDKKVYQIYKEKFIMDQVLPQYLSEWATKKSMLEGVQCIPSSEVEDYTYKNGQLSLVLSENRTVDADQVVVAVGVEPNTGLALDSHLETDPVLGGILVNAELQARSNVWVAGDVACFHDIRLGRRRVEHHDHAVISGRLAGENMTGAEKPYLHQSMFWSDLGPEVGYEAIGIVDSSLPTVGVFAKPSEPVVSSMSASNSNETTLSSSDDLQKLNTTQTQSSIKAEVKSETIKSIDEQTNSKETDKSVGDDSKPTTEEPKKYDDFGKGVIFYLRDDIVVGIVLWNIFNRMSVARQVLARGTKYDDLNEVAKLFTIHDD
ncbi:apoptosis-inducing factor 1, mitochondrial isoform X1 [Hylaeus volcanicus]|uniref:apoptosis-inducing factor 1, mitochondrial isoform X1 n=1 Tax=Hylaeus volcanicus TaxID=313075 RepID=UPI0023B77B99|nr:apoptosis-inducing factor 1, mitochondrial isoform X1 [Hylaeus volcanicus]